MNEDVLMGHVPIVADQKKTLCSRAWTSVKAAMDVTAWDHD